MKKLILIVLWFVALGAFAQTSPSLPVGSMVYGNTYFLDTDGNVWAGSAAKQYRIVAQKGYMDSINALGWSNAQVDSAISSKVAGYIPLTQKGAADGVATLDGSTKIPMSQIPDALVGSVNYQGNYNASTNTPTLPSSPSSITKGHYYVVATGGTQFGETFAAGDWIISNGSEWQKVDNNNAVTSVSGKVGAVTLNVSDVNGALAAGDNVSLLTNDAGYITSADIPAPPVTSVNGMTGAVTVSKADVGLGNVDNTSDANKPISSATQGALDLKEDKTNKVASLSTPNNTTYPTTQAVKNAIDAIEPPNVTGSNGIQVNSGEISPVYGTSAGTIAAGNDSRINNGQAAFGWGNHAVAGYIPSNGAGNLVLAQYGGDYNDLYTSVTYGSSSATNNPSVGHTFTMRVGSTLAAQIHANAIGDSWYLRKQISGNFTPWYSIYHSGNFNPGDYIPLTQKGAANGVATLDGSGKVPSSQIPVTGMQYQGTWNAATNTPTLSNSTGSEGYFYRVTTAGTQNLGSGNITFSVGDDVIHNGTVWQRAPSGSTSTNLALGTRTSTSIPITNSNGSGVTIPARTSSLAGLMTPTDVSNISAAITAEVDPTVPSHVKSISTGNISSWNAKLDFGDNISNLNNDAKYIPAEYTTLNAGTSSSDWNTLGTAVVWANSGAINGPGVGHTWSARVNSSLAAQIHANGTGDVWRVRKQIDGVWQNWRTLWDSNNFNPADYVTNTGFTWANLSGKPSTFTPSAHTHNASDINAGTLSLSRIPIGTTGSTVALGNHTHTASAITSGTLSIARIPIGTSSSTVAAGNDSRIVNAVPNSRTVNGKALTSNISLSASDVGAVPISGNATVTGSKTFSSPVTGADGTANNHFVTKQQIPALVSQGTGVVRLIEAPLSGVFKHGGSGNYLYTGVAGNIYVYTLPAGTFQGGKGMFRINVAGTYSTGTGASRNISVEFSQGGNTFYSLIAATRDVPPYDDTFNCSMVATSRSGGIFYLTKQSLSERDGIKLNSETITGIDFRNAVTIRIYVNDPNITVDILPLTIEVADLN